MKLFGDYVVPQPFAIPGGGLWGEVHEIIAYGMAGLVALHVLAALWHEFVVKDGTLQRMMLRQRRPVQPAT